MSDILSQSHFLCIQAHWELRKNRMSSTEHVDESAYGNIMEVDLHGKLSREDYDRFAPETERMIQEYGKVWILVNVGGFEGWDEVRCGRTSNGTRTTSRTSNVWP